MKINQISNNPDDDELSYKAKTCVISEYAQHRTTLNKNYLKAMLLYDNNTDLFLSWGGLRYMMYVQATLFYNDRIKKKEWVDLAGGEKWFKKNTVCVPFIYCMILVESSTKAFLIRINKMYIADPQVYVFRIMYLMCCVFPPIKLSNKMVDTVRYSF